MFRSLRTLLVDDEEPARDRLRALLADFDDVDVLDEARDGHEALQKIERTRPDLVFLDIEMPGPSGMEVVRSLRPPRPRVIFCTAYDRYAIEAFEHHATDYLLKPVSRDRLSRTLDRVRASIRDREGLRRAVDDASRTQERLLPRAAPAMEGLDYAGFCRAAHGVGGDYYDFLTLGPGRLGLAVADVSGKGLAAGLLMASLQATVQGLAPSHAHQLDRLAAETSRRLGSATDSNRYATLFFAVYDDDSRTLRYVNAGHLPPLVVVRGGEAVRRLAASGTVIGLIGDTDYREETVALASGDILVLYSDGVTEARSSAHEEFGEARLQDAVVRHATLDAERLVEAIVAEIGDFTQLAPQEDDRTLVVAKVR